MIKKLITTVLLFLIIAVNEVSAQQVGSWNIYQIFSGNNNMNLIDTDRHVYFLSDGWLYSYDKDEEELCYYNKINGLSDTDISGIYYNYEKKYLFVTYSNSNIDILSGNGRVDNIPDLKNVIMTSSKAINSVDFLDKYAYVATDFGYMVVDCEKFVVKESYNYGKQFNSIIATDKYIYANFDNCIYVSDLNASHYEIGAFRPTNFAQKTDMKKLSNDCFLLNSGWVYSMTIGADPTQLSVNELMRRQASLVSKWGEDFILSYKDLYLVLDANGNKKETVAVPAEIDGSFISSFKGDTKFWNLDADGLRHFDLSSDGSVTVLHDSMLPNASSVTQPYYMTYANHRLYEMNSGANHVLGADSGTPFGLSCLEEGQWKQWSNVEFTLSNSNSKSKFSRPYGMTVDPKDPGSVWFGSFFEGIYCVKNGKQLLKFDHTNSPFLLNYVCCVPDLKFDDSGNLWVVFFNYKNSSYSQLHMLPAAKIFNPNVQASDWLSWNFGNNELCQISKMMIKDNRYVMFADNVFKTKLMILDNNGTSENTADDKQVTISSFVDQDGKVFEIGYITCFKESSDGKIWIGTEKGIGVINNVKSAFNNSFVVSRVKVARNDGTNLADYLLDGTIITCIEEDGAGRKWIGTTTSGAYLVSADGSEILDHFMTENSLLTDDLVTSIACNADNNKVYIGTKKGTLIYQSDAAPAKGDYSNVYAYPNPVRPDYTGYITVAGLMDNSLVKIADAAGNVVYSGKSTGGMFVWNGCNSDGSRVHTGVYYVFASQSTDGSSSGCVTKILVVR